MQELGSFTQKNAGTTVFYSEECRNYRILLRRMQELPSFTQKSSGTTVFTQKSSGTTVFYSEEFRNYRLLLRRMQLTSTTWVESLNTRDDGQDKTRTVCQKQVCHCLNLFSLVAIFWRFIYNKTKFKFILITCGPG